MGRPTIYIAYNSKRTFKHHAASVILGSLPPFSATQHPPLRTSPATLLTAHCRHPAADRDAAVRPVEPAIRCERKISIQANLQSADFADLGYSNFADAAFLCACGKCFATLQFMSWKRSLTDSFGTCSQTALSLRYHRIFEMRHRVDVRGLPCFHLLLQRKRASTKNQRNALFCEVLADVPKLDVCFFGSL